ncbi:Dyp-type peroxidase [Streptomyces purpureus]|nr:Dyp-type peroxidase [Streptomyces purpureus]
MSPFRDDPRNSTSIVPALIAPTAAPGQVTFLAMDVNGRRQGSAAPVRRLRAALSDALLPDDGCAALAIGHSLLSPSNRPRLLGAMPSFPGDLLDGAHSHGDVLLQVAAHSKASVRQAVERVLEASADWRVRWRIDGFRADGRADGGRALSRNPFHFTEGFGNPGSERETADRALVRADQGEPAWAVGGSYQVVRIVRLATELWDKDSVEEQEDIIGRRRDGRWLDGTPIREEPNFAADPAGKLTPLDSHVRLAAPDRRNPPPIVRRSYSYDRGDGDTGLIFSCFQRDLAKGFEAVQKRLEGEAMAKYLLTTGGGYYFVPPPGDEWIKALT